MTTSNGSTNMFPHPYNMLETAVPMVDVAMHTIKHITRLFISHVSEKVKSDFFRIVIMATATSSHIALTSLLFWKKIN
jgi:hypothetical protein